ncbi:unnamed protein product [Bursaphelenchus okinawaensis]|uniref:Glutaredoxin domain-containing protein n=1 Tax=Bursaphelenchus okinawaensis TaxID=465554 RepID=A0A811JTE3_9BILA|nr:unnamed protein product [Bursaphelenchus okinawaensis]CAG9082492.1 unnamed protein product [Bursaphelenchus okinawaensis]
MNSITYAFILFGLSAISPTKGVIRKQREAEYENSEGQLNAFKTDSQKTGSAFGPSASGFGSLSNAYWSAYGNQDGQPDMQLWQGPVGSANSAQPTGQDSGYGQGYGAIPGTGAVGTPNSPYAGYLEKQISSYPVMIYTLNECVPCQRAKHLLAVHYPDVRAHFLELSGNEAWQQQLQVDLQYLTGAITFPYIFVCGQYIGGASDLFEMHENGQLRRMVNQCIKTATPKP